jgi:steroid 5-alpha reductase family enzyme
MLSTLALALAFMIAVMTTAYVVIRVVKDASWIDVFWTFGTGIAGAAVALVPAAEAWFPRQAFVAALVALWSLRLGSYIAMRVLRGPEDARYRRLKTQWGPDFNTRILGAIMAQAPATALLCVSIYVAAHRPGDGFALTDFLGFAILLMAIAGEGLADDQLKRFKHSAPHGSVADRGLWAWSRHPNYFFEWFGWLAYPLIAIDFAGAYPQGWLALVAPIVMYVILTRITGVPILEATMEESRGEAYRAYQRRVSRFFLWPPKKTEQRTAS